jgi:hypothetical protein
MVSEMPNVFGLPEATTPKLSSHEYEAFPSGRGGTATFLWSDGTVTKKAVLSDAEALRMVEAIQRNGGLKPD